MQDAWFGATPEYTWHSQQINTTPNKKGNTGGPPALGSLFVSVYNDQRHWAYIDRSGNVQDAWYGTDGWHLQQITQGPAAISGEYIVTHPGPKAAGDPFVSVYNGQQHFAYLDRSGNVQDVWNGTDGWHLQQLNNK